MMPQLRRILAEPRIASNELRIAVTELGFCVTGFHRRLFAYFEWSEITKATAFKRDCFTVDQINLQFEFRDRLFYCVNEEMQGWHELVSTLPHSLPGARHSEDWFLDVSHPPFALSLTEVYVRISNA